MIYEYRKYEAVPGQLPDLHRRFQTVTLEIWRRHGIRPVGFWIAEVGASNVLHYLLAWESMAERERVWTAFQSDPEWVQARARTEAAGPLVAKIENMFWTPTSYSPLA